jgi:nitrate/nitrite transporter NarK
LRRLGILIAVILAGELVFSLPFHTIRYFRPTFLDVFAISNTDLGDMFAAYGIVAMLAYFPGGALADRFSPRVLITVSLAATALGGFYLATLPGNTGLIVVYAYWGMTTVFLLWGAMLRVTRLWGGDDSQGLAFGLLDGGRGLVAALAAGFAIVLLAGSLPEDVELASMAERQGGMRLIILAYSILTLAAGALAWLLIPGEHSEPRRTENPWLGMREVVRRPTLWAHAGVIICAYCAYKGLDSYSLYAVDVLGMDEVAAARLVRDGAWLRPVAALAAGVLADRIGGSWLIAGMFALLVGSYGLLALPATAAWVVVANLFVTMFLAFGLRGVYFAIMNENRTPPRVTGATVGLVSFIGFTPEIFFAPITGRILDASPGPVGHQHYFLFLTGVAVLGVVVTLAMVRLNQRGRARANLDKAREVS